MSPIKLATVFEEGWANCPPGASVHQKRLQRFDRNNGIFYAPVLFDYVTIKTPDLSVQREWVSASLKQFVKGEFGESAADGQPFPSTPECRDRVASGDEPYEYLEHCERSLVYSGYLDKLLSRVPANMVSQIYAIICDEHLGHKKNRRYLTEDIFRSQIEPLLREHKRLTFVFSAFPFKDQNPFRTECPPEQPDLAELALLIRLHTLSLVLWQVHPQGADWVLVCDGNAYAEIFGVSTRSVEQYRQTLVKWRNRLNLQGSVSIIDLTDLAARINGGPLGSKPTGPFEQVQAAIFQALIEISNEGDANVRQALSVLQRGMTWNLNLRDYLNHLTPEELWYVAKAIPRNDEATQVKRVRQEVHERAWQAAIRYAAFNLTLRHFNAFNSVLPSTLRATIHPKESQLAVPSLGNVFPWNGVAVYRGGNNGMSVEVAALSDLRGPHHRSALPGQAGYFYYTPEEKG